MCAALWWCGSQWLVWALRHSEYKQINKKTNGIIQRRRRRRQKNIYNQKEDWKHIEWAISTDRWARVGRPFCWSSTGSPFRCTHGGRRVVVCVNLQEQLSSATSKCWWIVTPSAVYWTREESDNDDEGIEGKKKYKAKYARRSIIGVEWPIIDLRLRGQLWFGISYTYKKKKTLRLRPKKKYRRRC